MTEANNEEPSRTTEHFADRLDRCCRQKGSAVCVGIDPVFERLPPALRGADGVGEPTAAARVDAIRRYCEAILHAVAPHVACVKIQSACFERYLWPGVKAYHALIQRARSLGLVVIGDAKRGDIAVSAAHYGAGCLAPPAYHDLEDSGGPPQGPDALTVATYLGRDSLDPLLDVARREGRGLFALVRTSNPGGDAIQGLALEEGGTVAEAVARMVAEAGSGDAMLGRCGDSLLGAVVGAAKADAARLRDLMPRQIFLVPGFGAQGGGPDDVAACFRSDGTGAVITASRSILYAFERSEDDPWTVAVEKATVDMKQQVAAVLGVRP